MSSSFRKRNALHTWELHFGPNMTPMVDVVMVILVFFMASTAFIGPEWLLRVGLAERDLAGESGFQLGPAELVVRLEVEQGAIVVSGLGLVGRPLAELGPAVTDAARQLGGAIKQTHIVLEPGDAVPYEAVVQAQDELAVAGFEHVAIR